MKSYDAEIKAIQKAFFAAEAASAEYKKEHGEGWPCGFAWVVIKPATCSLVRALKELNRQDVERGSAHRERYGHKHYSGGWAVWNPGNDATQDMNVKYAGARAFADSLRASGYDNVLPDCRMD